MKTSKYKFVCEYVANESKVFEANTEKEAFEEARKYFMGRHEKLISLTLTHNDITKKAKAKKE